MGRRTLVWHIGLPHSPRPVIGANLEAHAEALGERGRRVVATRDEAGAATHELLRSHERGGPARSEVEGTWSRICDRVWEHRGTSLLSTPELGAADKDQLRLALDALIGVEVHLVVTLDTFSQQMYGAWLAELRAGRTTGWDRYAERVLALGRDGTREHRQAEDFWAGHELGSLLARWGWTFHADRLHVVTGTDVTRHWAGLLDVAGLGGEVAALPAVVPAYADPAGVAVLRRVNRQLDDRVHPGGVDLLVAGAESSAMPVVPTQVLAPVVARWADQLAAGSFDLRGDLGDLLDTGPETSLPGPRDQLGVAVDALVDALEQNARLREEVATLEADRARLDRKRRKLKRRLAAALAR